MQAKISEVTIVLHLKVSLIQERFVNRNAVNKNREKKIKVPNLGLGKCLLFPALPCFLADTGQVTKKSAMIVTSRYFTKFE